jgi:plastocyanin
MIFSQTFLKMKNNFMKIQVRFLTILSLIAALHSASAADVTGTVTLKGTPPAEKDIELTPACGAIHKGPMKSRFYTVGAKGELADVVVVLKGVPAAKSSGAEAKPILLDQVGCQYTPYFSVAQTGQKIMVKNSDTEMHNVHPMPAVAGNKEENKAQMPKSADLTFVFDKPEQFLKFSCQVHPWMIAYVSVFDHPYFALTGKDGTYKISNVPPGKYTIEAYHRKTTGTSNPVSKPIEVTDKGATSDFTIELK